MSPIIFRPIREQLEHDRVIRQLQKQSKWRREFEVAVNLGAEEEVAVKVGQRVCYPDLVLTRAAGARRLYGVVEVETAESVNHLEAMAEWSHFAKARGVFYLYVPAGFTDIALRLCQNSKINVTEIWAYYAFGSQAKFSMTYRSPRATRLAKAAKKKGSTKKIVKSATVKPRKVAKTKSRITKVRKATLNKRSQKSLAKKRVTKKSPTKKRVTKKSPTKKRVTKKSPEKRSKVKSRSKNVVSKTRRLTTTKKVRKQSSAKTARRKK